jgi:8-oxo-dGTP diphosphatase
MTEPTLAAGAVVWRRAAGRPAEVLLVHRPRYGDWSLPKGKREPGEHILLTAVREVFEETSLRPLLGPRLPDTTYQGLRRPKVVSYWSARHDGTPARASREVDEVCWLPLAQARARLSYPRDAAVLDALRPRATVPLIVLRHASAGQKGQWPADDEIRPLDSRGVASARRLADLLACFAPDARVISSPAVRCTETVRPYAARSGGRVEADAALSPPGRSGVLSSRTHRADSVPGLIGALLAGGGPAVVCLHRENLPQALAAACAALGAPGAVPDDPQLPKGGFFVVHASGAELAGLDRYEP